MLTGSSQTTDATTGTSQTTQSTGPSQTTQSNGSQQTTSGSQPGPTTAKPSGSTSNDKCEKEGFMADSSNCKKFYRCVSNGKGGYTKYDFDCPEGTAWSQELETCDYADNSGCTSKSETTSSAPQNSTTSAPQTTTTQKTTGKSII